MTTAKKIVSVTIPYEYRSQEVLLSDVHILNARAFNNGLPFLDIPKWSLFPIDLSQVTEVHETLDFEYGPSIGRYNGIPIREFVVMNKKKYIYIGLEADEDYDDAFIFCGLVYKYEGLL